MTVLKLSFTCLKAQHFVLHHMVHKQTFIFFLGFVKVFGVLLERHCIYEKVQFGRFSFIIFDEMLELI